MATSMTMDEMDEVNKEGQVPNVDLTKQMVDGASVPEELRGKSTQDLLDMNKRLADSLRASEDARVRAIAEQAARAAVPAPVAAPAPVAPEGPKDLTAEELEALVREDPTKALTLAMEQTRRRTTRDLEARINPLINAGFSTAEQMARAKHASDFELLGPEIDAFMKTIPEDQKRVALGNAEGWETMLNYIRGQNVDKIVSARVDKAITDRLGAARSDQAASAPKSIATATVPDAPVMAANGVVWDATTIEIMKNVLNCEDTPKARAEWTKWSNAKSGQG